MLNKKRHQDLDLVTDSTDAKVTIDRKTFLILYDDFYHAPRVTLEEKKRRLIDHLNTAQSESQLVAMLNYSLVKTKFAMQVRKASEENPDFFEGEEWE